MKSKRAKNQKFIFCYSQGQPQTLVMLKSSHSVIEKMYCIKYPSIVWISPEHQAQKRLVQKQLNIQITEINNFSQFNALSLVNQKTILITNSKLLNSIGRQQVLNNKIKIILYQKSSVVNIKQNSDEQSDEKILHAYDLQILINILKLELVKNYGLKQLPNFISLKDQVSYLRITRALIGMIYQKVNKSKMIQMLQELSSLIPQKNKDFIYKLQFFSKIKKGNLTAEQTIQWYTAQCFLYDIVNKLLRCTVDPCQLYYIQPYFSQLFKSICKIYEQQQKLKKTYKKNFTCFRGGVMSQEQIKFFKNNIGGIVLTLGFLSSSKNQIVVFNKDYVTNVLFEIEVNNNDRQYECDYGYVHAGKYSKHPQQQQVLFNCLNTFKIISISYDSYFYTIKLKYGEISRLMFSIKSTLNQMEKSYIQIQQRKNRAIGKQNLQGYILINQSCYQQTFFYYEGSEQYWKKYIQISMKNKKKKKNLAEGYKMLGQCHYVNKNYRQAYKLLIKSQLLIQKIYGSEDLRNGSICNNIGNVLVDLQEYLLALYYYKKSLKIAMKQQYSDSYLSLLNNLLYIYQKINAKSNIQKIKELIFQVQNSYNTFCNKQQAKMKQENSLMLNNDATQLFYQKKYQLALQKYNKSLQINISLSGQFNPGTAMILYNMGCTYLEKKEYDTALFYLEKCLIIRKNIFGQYSLEYFKSILILVKVCILNLRQKDQLYNYCQCLQNILELYENKNDSQAYFFNSHKIEFYYKLSFCYFYLQNQQKSAKMFTCMLYAIKQKLSKDFPKIKQQLQKVIKEMFLYDCEVWIPFLNIFNLKSLCFEKKQTIQAAKIVENVFKLVFNEYDNLEKYKSKYKMIGLMANKNKIQSSIKTLKQVKQVIQFQEDFFIQSNIYYQKQPTLKNLIQNSQKSTKINSKYRQSSSSSQSQSQSQTENDNQSQISSENGNQSITKLIRKEYQKVIWYQSRKKTYQSLNFNTSKKLHQIISFSKFCQLSRYKKMLILLKSNMQSKKKRNKKLKQNQNLCFIHFNFL